MSRTFDVRAPARYQRSLKGRWPVPNTVSDQKLTRHLGGIARRSGFEHTPPGANALHARARAMMSAIGVFHPVRPNRRCISLSTA